jgi:hypothetical protein
MRDTCENRLTVIGAKTTVRKFQRSDWERRLGAKYADLIECPPGRFVCQFETAVAGLKRLQALSRRWPGLVLLLDFEWRRIKGLARARAGDLEHCEVSY